jgi:asparagine synthase (glutamine-hydrolysing)
LHTFSAVFDEVTQCDERPFIDAVLAENNLEPHYFHADQFSPLTDLNRVLWHLEDASFGGNLYFNWCLYGSAQKQGVRILLEGFDGDTTVSHGAGYLIELARAKRWITLSREARGYARHFNLDPRKIVWRHVEQYGLSPRVRQSLRFCKRAKRALLRRATYPFGSRAGDLAPRAIVKQDFLQRINFGQRCQSLRTPRINPLTERDIHHSRLNWAVMPSILETLNKTAGAFSLENRFPFWDKRLVEFCLALPANQKLHQGWNRIVMRRAMEGILPKEVQWRGGKADMTAGVEHGLLTFERERLEELILRNSEIIANYVNTTSLREAYQRFTLSRGAGKDGLEVWKAVSLALWLQSNVLEPRPQAIT